MKMEYRNMQDFLNRCGVLEKGNSDEIREAKKTYRRMYMREYKKRKRKESKEVVLMMSRKKHRKLHRQAKETGLNLSSFILGLLDGKSFVPLLGVDRDALARMAILLAKIHSEMSHIADQAGSKEHEFGRIKNKVSLIESVFVKLFRGQAIDEELEYWNIGIDTQLE